MFGAAAGSFRGSRPLAPGPRGDEVLDEAGLTLLEAVQLAVDGGRGHLRGELVPLVIEVDRVAVRAGLAGGGHDLTLAPPAGRSGVGFAWNAM